MSFRQIFDRLSRIARAEIGSSRDAYERELRRAEELIEESRRPRRTTVDDSGDADRARAGSADSSGGERRRADEDEAYRRACATVGVAPGASIEQVAIAYRMRAREFHPDRVAHLSADQQRAALRQMQELNLAYEYLERRAAR